jgi:hypothetical protein
VVPGVAVVALYGDSVRLAYDVALVWEHFCESVPVVCVENATLQVLHFVVEPPECCRITTAEHPGHGSPCITVNGLDDPKLVFFEPTKCHISSNSISLTPLGTSGSGSASPNSRTHRYINEWLLFKMRPIILKDPFAIA